MIILVGNSPSSGSTFLADLLDSFPNIACGPESRFFSNEALYKNFHASKNKLMNRFAYSYKGFHYRKSLAFHEDRLKSYSIDKTLLKRFVEQSESFPQLINCIKKRYLNGRAKEIWVEKTPVNIIIADKFLSDFKKSFFIHIYRHPLHVYNSLRKSRNYPPLVAIGVWLMDMSIALKVRGNERLLEISYEDLVKDPFEQTAKLVERITGKKQDKNMIKKNYLNNEYRLNLKEHIKKWSVPNFGEITNANQKPIDNQIIKEFNSFRNLRVSKKFAAHYDIPRFSVDEVCEAYNYPQPTSIKKMYDIKSHFNFAGNFILDFLYQDCSLGDIFTYLRPFQR